MKELSKAEKLLVAAGRLAVERESAFPAEDLIVRAFKEFPRDFSLKGHPEYPDSNSVLIHIMGKKARLIASGWLEKVGTKQYRVTTKGLHDLSVLTETDTGAAAKIRLHRELEEGLGRLLTSGAYDTFRGGRADEITFHQFCRFAGLSARDKWQKVTGKFETLRYLVDEAKRLGEAGETIAVHFRDRNYQFSPDDLRNLAALEDYLTERFKSEMDEWKRNAFS